MQKQHLYYVALVLLCFSISLPLKAENPATLKAAFGKSFAVGAAIPGPELSDAEQSLLVTNFTNVTPENCLKPAAIEPEEGKFTFAAGNALVAFAQSHGLKVNGHTLVWHQHCPDWFFLDQGKTADGQLVLQRMREHITGEVSHYRGKVASWDVVNEAIADGSEYLRNSRWLASIGPNYIAEAFLAAQKPIPTPNFITTTTTLSDRTSGPKRCVWCTNSRLPMFGSMASVFRDTGSWTTFPSRILRTPSLLSIRQGSK